MWRRSSHDRDAFLLALFIGTDLVFVALHLLHTWSGFFTDPRFAITQERGFAETFQYLKEGWIAAILLSLWLRTPGVLYASWALLFGYLLVDDLFEVHERLGAMIGGRLGLPRLFSLRPQDIGEVLVSGSAAAVFSLVIGVGHYRADPPARSVSRSLLAGLVILALFGVVVDTIHAMVSHPIGQIALDVLEDGGEMLTMSVIVWFVFRSLQRPPPEPCATVRP